MTSIVKNPDQDVKNPGRTRSRNAAARSGFSAREAILVTIILGVAVALFATWTLRRREEARRLRCEQRLIELAQSIRYHDELQGGFPGYRNLQTIAPSGQRIATGWVFPLLPYLERRPGSRLFGPWADVYDRYGPESQQAERAEGPKLFLSALVCPAIARGEIDPRAPLLDFVANSGLPDFVGVPPSTSADAAEELSERTLPPDWPANGVFQDHFLPNLSGLPQMSLEFLTEHDGAEHTWLFSENVDAGKWTDHTEPQVGYVWIPEVKDGEAVRGEGLLEINELRGEGPADGEMRFARPSSLHVESVPGANAVYASGRTQFVSETIDYLVFTQLMSSDGESLRNPGTNEPIGPPYSRSPLAEESE